MFFEVLTLKPNNHHIIDDIYHGKQQRKSNRLVQNRSTEGYFNTDQDLRIGYDRFKFQAEKKIYSIHCISSRILTFQMGRLTKVPT